MFPGPRPRFYGKQKRQGEMNKLEGAYSLELERRRLAGEILRWDYEKITLKLADGCRYTPDFFVVTLDHELTFHEAKGPFRDAASIVKIKVAAESLPFRFYLVEKKLVRDGGGWEISEVGA